MKFYKGSIMGADASSLIMVHTRNQVQTITMNMPRRLNGWTFPMMEALKGALRQAESESTIKGVILTGADPYYCAGVNLGGTLRLAHPRTLHRMIVEHNQGLFETFINFSKPILVAVNGPAIGAAVTSATLCDGMIASDQATFSTPFAKLGVAREGCSTLLFEKLMGVESAERMLGDEGWIPSGQEALDVGLVEWCVSHDDLLERAQEIVEGWVQQGRVRSFRGGVSAEELREVNARESVDVADSFLSRPFLRGQFKFLWSRKKRGPALMFWVLMSTRFLWGRLLSRDE